MDRRLKLALLLAPLFLALAVLLDTPYHRLWNGELSGVLKVKPAPRWSLDSFWNGKYQSSFEQWFERDLAPKAAMVRTDNTINLFAFHDISAHTSIPIILGEDDTLFEMNYVNNSNGVSELKDDPPPRTEYSLQESTRRVARAAKAFQSLGIDFFVLFYPSKASIWRPRVPRRYRLPGGKLKAARGYQELVASLTSQGVPVVDAAQAFEDLARAQPTLPLYNRGGTHWTDAAACEVAGLAFAQLRAAAGGARLHCELGPSAPAQGVAADLANLINVWDNRRFLDPIPSVTASLSGGLKGRPERAWVVGTSFSEMLIESLQSARAIGSVKRHVYYRHQNARSIKWERELKAAKVVILEQCQWSFMTANNSEFLDDLEKHAPSFAAALQRVDAESANQ